MSKVDRAMLFSTTIIALYGLSLNDEVDLSYCQREGSCKNFTQIFKAGKPPLCYCDDDCEMYNDCCFDFNDSTRIPLEQSNNLTHHENAIFHTQNNMRQTLEDSTRLIVGRTKGDKHGNRTRKGTEIQLPTVEMDTCLLFNDSISGLWIVNRCSKTGNRCADVTDRDSIIRHLPVTDNQNVTYFGAECAICNGVQTFTAWGISAEDPRSPNGTDVLSLIENTEIETLPSTLEKFGRVQLIPPPQLSFRVCYTFSSKTKDEKPEECPYYQCPILVTETNDIFRNPECCEMSRKCPRSQRAIGWNSIDKISSLDFVDEIGSSQFTFVLHFRAFIYPGIIQQTGEKAPEKETPCTSDCEKPGSTSLSSSFQLLNYRFTNNLYLTLAIDGEYDIRYINQAFDMIYTFFWRSKWILSIGDEIRMYKAGKQCMDKGRVCTKLEFHDLLPMSATDLTINDIYYIESWTKKMVFSLEIDLPWFLEDNSFYKSAVGIISQTKADIPECRCKQGNVTPSKNFRGAFTDLIPTEWNTLRNDCIDHKLVSVRSEISPYKALKVYCTDGILTSGNISNKNHNCLFAKVLAFAIVFGKAYAAV